ncbi:MAG TPA: FtsX-like permease family protein, partial [Thermoleophilaceae bacterium]|nr:FtsX-like permease family protein [Thermoleophilaceae bacterium]
MNRLTLKGLMTRRLRTALTALAIVLGVAMVGGALTLTDTMRGAADSLSEASYDGTAAVVSAKTAFEGEEYSLDRPVVPESLLERTRAVRGVERAVGSVTDEARIVGKDGKAVGNGPYFGVGLDRAAGELSPFRIESGRFASGRGEVVIDAGTAEREGYAVGDRVRIHARGPAGEMRVSGIATFGDVDSIGTATFALFDLRTAQALFDKRGSFSEILVAGPDSVRETLRTELPEAKVQSAAAHDRFTLDGLKEFVGFLKTLLLVFGGVAVFVGAFTIFNSLSITVAQRSRELALLRALGATRRQVLRSVALEALLLGMIASVIGIAAGFGLAELISGVFTSAGVELPQTATTLEARTVVIALLVGVMVTVVAGLGPAMRATRVSPVAAMREGAELPPSRVGRHAKAISAAIGAVALAVLGAGLFAPGIDADGRLMLLAPGALLLFVAVALVSPRLVPRLASLLGRPGQRIAGVAGGLARRNAMRNPGRTAATAAALMIGIALVAFSAVLAAGMRESTSGALEDQVRGSHVILGHDGWSPIDPAAAAAAEQVPGVRAVSGIVQDEARAFGKTTMVDGVDPARIGQVFGWEWKDGSDATLGELGSTGAVVADGFAEDNGLSVGERFAVTAPSGRRLQLRVAGISKPDRFNPLGLGDVTVSRATFAGSFSARRERFSVVAAGTASDRALADALRPFADSKLQTKTEFMTDQSAWVDQILGIFYVLLGLAVIVSLFGIVNTLALSVLERTRELGMLRAIGMSRRQVRRMIRHESVVTALIGAVLGIGVGLFMAALATTALSDQGLRFALPVGSLVAFIAVAAVAGVLAATGPARRAGRLDVLRALQ